MIKPLSFALTVQISVAPLIRLEDVMNIISSGKSFIARGPRITRLPREVIKRLKLTSPSFAANSTLMGSLTGLERKLLAFPKHDSRVLYQPVVTFRKCPHFKKFEVRLHTSLLPLHCTCRNHFAYGVRTDIPFDAD